MIHSVCETKESHTLEVIFELGLQDEEFTEKGGTKDSRHSKVPRWLWEPENLKQQRRLQRDEAGMMGWAGQVLNAMLILKQ